MTQPNKEPEEDISHRVHYPSGSLFPHYQYVQDFSAIPMPIKIAMLIIMIAALVFVFVSGSTRSSSAPGSNIHNSQTNQS